MVDSYDGSIVRCEGSFIRDNYMNIVLEYMDEGSLDHVSLVVSCEVALFSWKSHSRSCFAMYCVAVSRFSDRASTCRDYSSRITEFLVMTIGHKARKHPSSQQWTCEALRFWNQ